MDDGSTGSPIAAIAIVVGGALAVLSAFLQWASVRVALPAGLGAGQAGSGGRLGRGILGRLFPNSALDHSVTGVRTPDGRLVLGVGIALLVLAAVAFLSRWAAQRAAVGAAAAALGAIALAVPVAMTATPSDAGLPAALSRLISLQVTSGAGVYVAMVGGAIAVVAGAWVLLSTGPAVPIQTVPATGPIPSAATPPPPTASTEVVSPAADA